MGREDRATWKSNYFVKLVQLLDEYPKCFIVGVDNVGSRQMQQIRLSLRKHAILLMGKNTMIRKAILGHMENNPALEKLIPHIRGNVGFVFTKEDLVEIREKIMDNKVKAPARAGALAPCDVILQPQNTGLGPEKTSFFQALQIPTKISKGTIEILNEIHLIKKEDKVGASEATLLNMLNVSPFTYGLKIQQVYDSGTDFSPEILDITSEDLLAKFMEGVMNIASVSLAIGYPTIASVPHSIVNGLKANMDTSKLMQEIKRHAVLVALAANHGDSEIAAFLNVARSFVFKIRKGLEASGGNVSSVAKRKRHSQWSEAVRKVEFVQQVQGSIKIHPARR